MSEMIERVAKELHEKLSSQDIDGYLGANFDLKSVASAAINAMREPTEAQLEAAEDIVVGYDDFAVGDGNIYLGIQVIRRRPAKLDCPYRRSTEGEPMTITSKDTGCLTAVPANDNVPVELRALGAAIGKDSPDWAALGQKAIERFPKVHNYLASSEKAEGYHPSSRSPALLGAARVRPASTWSRSTATS